LWVPQPLFPSLISEFSSWVGPLLMPTLNRDTVRGIFRWRRESLAKLDVSLSLYVHFKAKSLIRSLGVICKCRYWYHAFVQMH
jgi:RNase P/RNase MRP subunit POP5